MSCESHIWECQDFAFIVLEFLFHQSVHVNEAIWCKYFVSTYIPLYIPCQRDNKLRVLSKRVLIPLYITPSPEWIMYPSPSIMSSLAILCKHRNNAPLLLSDWRSMRKTFLHPKDITLDKPPPIPSNVSRGSLFRARCPSVYFFDLLH